MASADRAGQVVLDRHPTRAGGRPFWAQIKMPDTRLSVIGPPRLDKLVSAAAIRSVDAGHDASHHR